MHQADRQARLPFQSAIATPELDLRAIRPPNFEAESRALSSLMQTLSNGSADVLGELVATAMDLCCAQSAGMSILEKDEDSEDVFRFRAATGALSSMLGRAMPGNNSPCALALAANRTILLREPELHFDLPANLGPKIYEVLLVPFRVDGEPTGTLWVISHQEDCRFDREDERILISLGKFGSAAFQFVSTHEQWASERKLREATLQKSEQRYREMFDSLPAAIYTTDADGFLTYFNPTAREFAGRQPQLGVDRWCIGGKVYRPDGTHVPHDRSAMALALQSGYAINVAEGIMERPDTSRIWFAAYPTPLYNEHGQLTAGINMLVDISARKRAELENQARTAQFETLLNEAPLGLYLVDDQFRICHANPTAIRAFGLEPSQLIGSDLSTIVRGRYPDDRATEILNHFQRTLDTGESYVVPERLVERQGTGTREYYEWQINRIPLADGRYGVVCYFRNISRQVTALEAVKESESRLRFMAESMPQKILAAAPNGDVTYFNQRWLEFTGKPFEEIRNSGWLRLIHADDREEAALRWREAVLNGEPLQLVHRLRRFDNVYRWHLSRIVPMRQPDGCIAMWIGSNTDIHEQKQMEEDLLRANADLNQFAYAASHDLQEPLRMIASYSQLLVSSYRGQLEGDAETCLHFITEGSRRMRELLAGLLSYARAGTERTESSNLVDLNSALRKALQNLQATITENGATVSCDPLPSVRGEEGHFVQLLQNLIGNSVKYQSTEPPRIHVSARCCDGLWQIGVSDNGVGIAPEDHQRIFGVFKRLPSQGVPGAGIGLAICQRVVERYGGRIWVDSQLGEGATFYLTLPTAEESPVGMDRRGAVA